MHTRNLPQGALGCHAVVRTESTDKLNTFDRGTEEDDDSLRIVQLSVEVTADSPEDAEPVADAIEAFLDAYNGSLGGTWVTDREDIEEEPEDQSPQWRPGVRLSVTLEHTPE
ncbi:MAG: hypothetical protein AB7U64_22535 [Blastocatellales bacterium]